MEVNIARVYNVGVANKQKREKGEAAQAPPLIWVPDKTDRPWIRKNESCTRYIQKNRQTLLPLKTLTQKS